MYKLIEWDSKLYYWLIIINESRIVEVFKDIAYNNPNDKKSKKGDYYTYTKGKHHSEHLIAESDFLEELRETALLHLL